jgi:glycine cleavage system H protein
MYPSDYLYSRDHEWVRIDEDLCVVGITQYAQEELGEVVFVELPEVGQVFDSRDEIGTIESVKAVAEIYTPVAGEVVEINQTTIEDPAILNEDPHGEGWLVKIRFSEETDLDELMNAEQYERYITGEGPEESS